MFLCLLRVFMYTKINLIYDWPKGFKLYMPNLLGNTIIWTISIGGVSTKVIWQSYIMPIFLVLVMLLHLNAFLQLEFCNNKIELVYVSYEYIYVSEKLYLEPMINRPRYDLCNVEIFNLLQKLTHSRNKTNNIFCAFLSVATVLQWFSLNFYLMVKSSKTAMQICSS